MELRRNSVTGGDGAMLDEIKHMLAERDLSTKDALRLMLRAQMSMLTQLDEQGQHTHPEFKTAWRRDFVTAIVAMVTAFFTGAWSK